jgi:hypothetical protein
MYYIVCICLQRIAVLQVCLNIFQYYLLLENKLWILHARHIRQDISSHQVLKIVDSIPRKFKQLTIIMCCLFTKQPTLRGQTKCRLVHSSHNDTRATLGTQHTERRQTKHRTTTSKTQDDYKQNTGRRQIKHRTTTNKTQNDDKQNTEN